MHLTGTAKKRIGRSLLLGCSAILAASISITASASSHKEAPFIDEMPKVDGTDFYMYRSYEAGRAAFVTFNANYNPFQDPQGGPNFYKFDPLAVYEIHVDNNGDAKEDITFQFKFTNTNKDTKLPIGGKMISIPLINSGAIAGVNPATINVRETYTVQVVRAKGTESGSRRSGTRADITNAANGATVFDKPIANIGNKTIADYAAYAAAHVYNINIPGCAVPGRMFVGQRKESFVINVGETFDLLNIPPAVITGQESARANDLEGKNISTIALEVPTVCLTQGAEPVIGAWTTASVRQARIINPFTGTFGNASKQGGAFSQVSRLGMPLVNEVVIGLKDKDLFNAAKPEGDAALLDYVTNPFMPAFIESLFTAQGVKAPTKFPRNDLVAVFLTGITGLNKPASGAPSEMLRLNTAIAPVAKGAQNRLGVIGGDLAGFPNGRRPGDDVVDIELRVLMGVLCTLNQPLVYGCVPADAPSGAINFTDGAITSDARFDAAFPYLTTPLRGSPQPQNTP